MSKRNLIIGIVVLTVLIGGVILWQQKNNKQDTKQQAKKEVVKQTQEQATVQKQETTEKEQTNNQNQTIDGELKPEEKIDTSDWKTYCDQEYKFCLKYPSEYKVKKPNQNGYVLFIQKQYKDGTLNIVDGVHIFIKPKFKTKEQFLQDIQSNNNEDVEIISQTQINIANQKTWRILSSFSIGYDPIFYFLQGMDKGFEIKCIDNNNIKNGVWCDTIAKTFRLK